MLVDMFLRDLLSSDEIVWKQRSMVLWLQGNCNSKYFRIVYSNRRRNNRVEKLQDESG